MSRVPRYVGIDLGTTFSTIAYLDEAGRPVPLPNRYGDLLTPSVVFFEKSGTIVVGHEAKKAAPFEPERVVECVKRDMGMDRLSHPVPGLELTPEEVSALILRRLKEDFETQVGPIAGAVITVPAYFDDQRRKATRDAGEIAGLNVTAVVNEPVAAALAFSLQGILSEAGATRARKGLLRDVLKAKTSLVFDLGGGTFDVTIVKSDGREVRTIATDGDVQLGGKDWDDRLVGWLAERFAQTHGTDPRNDRAVVADLHVAAEEAKRSLTARVTVSIRIQVSGSRFSTEMTREQFEELTADLIEQARTTTELVVDDSAACWGDIDNVLLVGGSSKMPAVQRMLQEVSGMTPDASLAADLAVAQGAAIYAAILAAKRAKAAESEEPVEELPFEGEVLTTLDEIEVHHVNSHSLGVVALRRGKKVNSILIKKNTPIPHAVTKTYGLEKDGQRTIDVVVLEGEARDPMACSRVGRFRVVDLPDGMPRGAPVRVTCRYDADGRIHVEATDLTSGNVGRIEVSRPHGLPPERKEQVAQAVRKLIIE